MTVVDLYTPVGEQVDQRVEHILTNYATFYSAFVFRYSYTGDCSKNNKVKEDHGIEYIGPN